MESSDEYKTPKKPLLSQSSILRLFNTTSGTPVNLSIKSQKNSLSRKINFSVLPVSKTTPTKSARKIINPFEAALTDRLHLPLIGSSPSLFQRPSTPQYSSTQFEWTIDDVSSLGPANVEPHETQFNGSPDPDIEAKAQAAISSFFSEHKIVPSPLIDGHIRSQQIIFTELTGHTPIIKSGRRIRDGVAQTLLTLPPILPPEIESLLKPFFTYGENQQQKPSMHFNNSVGSVDHEARDASLRRKLFDQHCYDDDTVSSDDIGKYEEFSPPPKSPEIDAQSLNSSINKNSFGSLSPISKVETPTKCKTKCIVLNRNGYRNNDSNDLSIMEMEQFKRSDCLDKSTSFLVGRSSSPTVGESSFDSNLNRRVKLLGINSFKCADAKSIIESDILSDDEMQISQGSTRSSISSDSFINNRTPRAKRRAANRKNLSRSFSCNTSDNDEINPIENTKTILSSLDDLLLPLAKKPFIFIDDDNSCAKTKTKTIDSYENKSTFHRTDSGFNEISNTQEDMKIIHHNDKNLKCLDINRKYDVHDVSMSEDIIDIIPFCSTPSKTIKTN